MWRVFCSSIVRLVVGVFPAMQVPPFFTREELADHPQRASGFGRLCQFSEHIQLLGYGKDFRQVRLRFFTDHDQTYAR